METNPPSVVRVRASGELVIRTEDLHPHVLEALKTALTVSNEEKEKQLALKTFGAWDMPDVIPLYRIETRRGDGEVICMPRGFASSLANGLQGMGLNVEWDDQRTLSPASDGYFKMIQLRDYQLQAAIAMMKVQQGIYKAPAGAGKTVTTLGMLSYLNQRTLVIVDRAGLLEQWRTRAAKFYDFPMKQDDEGHDIAPLTKGAPDAREAGKIGQDVWEERDLTICLRQTLHSRAWQLHATGWWKTWGAVIFDEAHHVTSDTVSDIVRCVSSVYMTGISATPAKSPTKAAIVTALIGPIEHETPRQVLYDRNVLVKPTAEILEGDFYTPFHPDHESAPNGDCQADGCTKRGKHRHRNNYSSALAAICNDEDRALRIAQRIVMEKNHVHLVPSSRLKHLNEIRRALLNLGWPKELIWMLRGEENARGEDQTIAQQVQGADQAVILSTVAGEGLDIPPIDRVHVSFPMRDHGALIQLVGRGERSWPGKESSVIIDYREPKCDVFELQFQERMSVYIMQGYPVVDSEWSVKEPMKEEVA